MTLSDESLKDYYDALPDLVGWDGRCQMSLPKELNRKTVLDLGCRRGKGVYKLAEQVGRNGQAIGVEWRAGLLESARENASDAARKAEGRIGAIRFVEAYPERLCELVDEGSIDFAYVNCVLNVLCDPVEALSQLRRVLKPGGLLVCDTVLATGPRKAQIVEQARAAGHAVQAAPHRKDLMGWLASAGFDVTSIGAFASGKVDAAADSQGNLTLPTVPSDEPVSFVATDVHVYAPDGIDRRRRSTAKDIREFR